MTDCGQATGRGRTGHRNDNIIRHPRVLLSGTGIHEAGPGIGRLDSRLKDRGNDEGGRLRE